MAPVPVPVVVVSAGVLMEPDSEPVPPVVLASFRGGLQAASPKAVMAANRNVDERFMVSSHRRHRAGTTT
jgi:hypothetical protein